MEQIKELAALIGRHAVAEGLTDVAVPRLGLFKSCTETMPQHVLYEPALCIVAQGRKRALLGDAAYIYDVASFLVVSVDLPVVGCVIEATQEEPYLSFRLDLNLPVLSELMLEHGGDGGVRRGGVGLGLSRVTPGLLDAAVRLLRLLDTPEDIAALAPLMEREILYRLLVGEQGAMLRHIACQDSRLSQISRAIAWIKGNFAAPFSIERLAAEAGMSASSFHHHFKMVTTMSPLQFRTQLRLQEARRLMMVEALDAASAGFRVGYESPSQFSRDYSKLFGAPPGRDAGRLRAAPEVLVAA